MCLFLVTSCFCWRIHSIKQTCRAMLLKVYSLIVLNMIGYSFYRGVALSWSLSSITMASLLFSYVKAFKLHEKTWPGKHGLSASPKQEVDSVFIIRSTLLYNYTTFLFMQ